MVKPASNVASMVKTFEVDKNRKKFYRALVADKQFFEQSAVNMFAALDKNKDGTLNLKELTHLLEPIYTRCAYVKVGFTWGLGGRIKAEYTKNYKELLKTVSSKSSGLDMFAFNILVRGLALFLAGTSDGDIGKIRDHCLKHKRILYKQISVSMLKDPEPSDPPKPVEEPEKPAAAAAAVGAAVIVGAAVVGCAVVGADAVGAAAVGAAAVAGAPLVGAAIVGAPVSTPSPVSSAAPVSTPAATDMFTPVTLAGSESSWWGAYAPEWLGGDTDTPTV